MVLSNGAERVLHTLRRHGFQAYAVGGAVRDLLRGITPDDIDIATDASPEKVMQVFSSFRTVPTGLRHGTVTVQIDRELFEITTYRTDGAYSDGRHPDSVQFTSSLTEDLARRDFTINAMAYAPTEGVIDPFGGRDDLRARRLRCVGDPMKRFSEDALRIARLVRFMSVLGFEAESETARAADALCSGLDAVAAERKRTELTKCLLGSNFLSAATTLPNVMARLVPALTPCIGFAQRNPHHAFDIYEHTVRAVAHAPAELTVRLALLLHDIGKPACFTLDDRGIGHFYGHPAVSHTLAEDALKALRFDNATIRDVLPLVKHHDIPIDNDRRLLKKRLQLLGKEGFERLLMVKEADAAACFPESVPPDFSAIRQTVREILAAAECLSLRDLQINGEDLLSLGYPQGPLLGTILHTLLEAVVAEELENNRETLLQYAKEYRKT